MQHNTVEAHARPVHPTCISMLSALMFSPEMKMFVFMTYVSAHACRDDTGCCFGLHWHNVNGIALMAVVMLSEEV